MEGEGREANGFYGGHIIIVFGEKSKRKII